MHLIYMYDINIIYTSRYGVWYKGRTDIIYYRHQHEVYMTIDSGPKSWHPSENKHHLMISKQRCSPIQIIQHQSTSRDSTPGDCVQQHSFWDSRHCSIATQAELCNTGVASLPDQGLIIVETTILTAQIRDFWYLQIWPIPMAYWIQ